MKHFYFPFYSDDFITGTLDMTCEEVGAYIRLLCYQFGKGAIPSDEETIRRIITKFDGNLEKILTKFPNGINKKLKKVMEDSKKRSRILSNNAKNGWDKRRMQNVCKNDANDHEGNMYYKDKVKYKDKYKYKEKEETPAKAGTPQAEFVKNWSDLYQSGTGHPYKSGREDFIIIARLLKDFGEAEVLFRAKILFELCKNHSAWFTKENGMGSFTIKNLSHKWNELTEGGQHGRQAGVSKSEIEEFMAGRKQA